MRNRRQRHISEVEPDSEGTWAISYGDLVTLLLTFFIIFFTVDKFQLQKSLKLDITAKKEKQSQIVAEQLKKYVFPDLKTKQPKMTGKVLQDGQRVLVEFSGVSFFNSGDVGLTNEARKVLNTFYSAYSPYMGQYTVGIVSFTDTRKVIQGPRPFKDNLELSALRSISVMRFLQRAGVPLSDMTLAGHGELQKHSRSAASDFDLQRTAVLIIEPREVL